ncbi:hypothetical protein BXZ70DRAFT_368305 [Cristinia sonorae]|uniref:BTB domain-containing protein n=1 Tax=Cristinia sonorae TaxID=1940300 RepID=A0A8K0XMN2_9AGAR|nr:hypothetical protein BXZ70DRAFT_368305 [Cristinia sonorae]
MSDLHVDDSVSILSDPESTVELHPAYPFIDDDADVILRTTSSDGVVDFKVHKIILSKASPFFSGMFTLPQSPNAGQECLDGKPIIDCVETPTAMRLLLLYIYPGEDPTITNLVDLSVLLDAAIKFEIEYVAAKARQLWTALVPEDPLRGFAIACLRRWDREACAAARVALREDIWPLQPIPIPEYERVSGNTILRLQRYHAACAVAARNLALSNREQWLHALHSEQCEHCSNHGSKHVDSTRTALMMSNWMTKYLNIVAEELTLRPSPATAVNPAVISRTIKEAFDPGFQCDLTSYNIDMLNRFVKHFSQKLEIVLCSIDPELEL